jgi:hypothetical protein
MMVEGVGFIVCYSPSENTFNEIFIDTFNNLGLSILEEPQVKPRAKNRLALSGMMQSAGEKKI